MPIPQSSLLHDGECASYAVCQQPQAVQQHVQACSLVCRVEQISYSPRAYIYHNFLSAMECEHIVKISRPLVSALSLRLPCLLHRQRCLSPTSLSLSQTTHEKCTSWGAPNTCMLVTLMLGQMRRSTVVGQGGKSVEDNIRTSYGTFLRHAPLSALLPHKIQRALLDTSVPLAQLPAHGHDLTPVCLDQQSSAAQQDLQHQVARLGQLFSQPAWLGSGSGTETA